MRVRMLLVPLAASVALLAGCTGAPAPAPTPTTNGLDAMTADEIMAAAQDAVGDADSFNMAGAIGEGALAVQLDLNYSGADSQGTASIFGVAAEIIKVGPDLYLNADVSFWATALASFLPPEQQAQAEEYAAQLDGVWAKVPAIAVAGLLPVPLTIDEVVADDGTDPIYTTGETTTLDGAQVITVTDEDGATYYVALVGEPYLLKVESDAADVEFSQFNEEFEIEAPEESVDVLALLLGTA